MVGDDTANRALAVDVDVVIPVFNEMNLLRANILKLHTFLGANVGFSWRITIVDNASTDATWGIACALRREIPSVRAVHIAVRGKGGAIRSAWMVSDAVVVSFMDVDLATDLHAFARLVEPVLAARCDMAIGSRLTSSTRVVRGFRRELASRAYNRLLRASLRVGFTDAQCGFKAARADVAQALLPRVLDTGWFFDTELLVHAERCGLRIEEVPVDWTEGDRSHVQVVPAAFASVRGILRLRFMPTISSSEVPRFRSTDARR